jgi:hypothetical protein
MDDYRRFMILSGPRTGSHMLAQALNSSPRIVCFREVFNGQLDFIQYQVDGYDDFSARDIALRREDPVRFLRERIFCEHPEGVRAVGFKFHYGHQWDFPGILDALAADDGLHVVRLERRNLLRMLVSLKLARSTGVWLQDGSSKLTPANALRAVRHPIKAVRRVRRMLARPEPAAAGDPPRRVTIPVDEAYEFMVATGLRYENFDALFERHPALQVYYEDMIAGRDAVFREVQSFLGVAPAPLEVTLRQQNPEPLRDLLENYDELYEAFRHTPQAAFFDEPA